MLENELVTRGHVEVMGWRHPVVMGLPRQHWLVLTPGGPAIASRSSVHDLRMATLDPDGDLETQPPADVRAAAVCGFIDWIWRHVQYSPEPPPVTTCGPECGCEATCDE